MARAHVVFCTPGRAGGVEAVHSSLASLGKHSASTSVCRNSTSSSPSSPAPTCLSPSACSSCSHAPSTASPPVVFALRELSRRGARDEEAVRPAVHHDHALRPELVGAGRRAAGAARPGVGKNGELRHTPSDGRRRHHFYTRGCDFAEIEPFYGRTRVDQCPLVELTLRSAGERHAPRPRPSSQQITLARPPAARSMRAISSCESRGTSQLRVVEGVGVRAISRGQSSPITWVADASCGASPSSTREGKGLSKTPASEPVAAGVLLRLVQPDVTAPGRLRRARGRGVRRGRCRGADGDWIERKDGGVWAVGRAVNPQRRPSAEPRADEPSSRAYELHDALEQANEALEDDAGVLRGGRGLGTRVGPFPRAEMVAPLEQDVLPTWLTLTRGGCGHRFAVVGRRSDAHPPRTQPRSRRRVHVLGPRRRARSTRAGSSSSTCCATSRR